MEVKAGCLKTQKPKAVTVLDKEKEEEQKNPLKKTE